jgi:hypothetical protein
MAVYVCAERAGYVYTCRRVRVRRVDVGAHKRAVCRLACLPQFYLLADVFSDATTAYVMCFTITLVLGTVAMLWTGFLRIFAWVGVSAGRIVGYARHGVQNFTSLYNVSDGLLRIIPQYVFCAGLAELAQQQTRIELAMVT